MTYSYFGLDMLENINNSLMFCGTYDVTHNYSTGDICIKDGYTYVYLGNNNWDYMSTIPCGYKTETPKIKYPTNCKNCGAILHNHICEYCGSDYSI